MQWGVDVDEHDSADQLKAFLEVGGTLVDTAASYGAGESECVIGNLLASVVDRDEIVLATKAGISRSTGERVVDASRRALLDSLDGSLRRLGTDRIDLWQVHTWDEGAPLEETLGALDFAVACGKARYVGISNYSGWQTACAVTRQQLVKTQAAIISTQMEYNLLTRGIEREVLPCANALGMGVLAWAPLAAGVLTGKYRSGTPADSRAAGASASFLERYFDERSRHIIDAVATAADGLGRSATEVALAWVRDAPGVTAAIVGARTTAQLRASLATESLELPAEIWSALDDVSTPPMSYPEV
jgi:aryl-alcohol dehydrogenase-like predicted oxidoreductase